MGFNGLGSNRYRCWLSVILLCSASGFGAGTLYIKGRVATNDSFPGSNLIVTLKASGVRDTTDTAGLFSLLLPTTATVHGGSHVNIQNQPGEQPASFVQVGKNTTFTGQDGFLFDLAGRTVGMTDARMNGAESGVYIRQSVGAPVVSSLPRQQSALPFSDTLIISYCDSIQKKMAISLADTGKNLAIILENDLAPKGHRFIAASYSNNAAFVISATNTLEATYKMPGPVQDVWKLANSHILLSGGDSVKEVDKDGRIVWGRKSPCGGEMHNCQPLPGGKRFFGENCTGKLFIADSQGTSSEVPNILGKDIGSANNHSRFRMVRKYDSLYLITAEGEGVVYMYNTKGDILRKIDNAKVSRFGVTFNAVHSAILLQNGNILIGTGYTGFFIEVDKRDSVVWKVGAADLPGVGLTYAAGCQRLRNGNTICSAYNSTTKFFEITRKKRIVWKSNANNVTGNPTHIFLLDIAGDPSKGELLR